MSKIPIKIERITVLDSNIYRKNNSINYLLQIQGGDRYWTQSSIVSRHDLIKLRDGINNLLDQDTTADILGVTEEQGRLIDTAHTSDPICEGCTFKMTGHCVICQFHLQSPLERLVYLALTKAHINFSTQYGINWQGASVNITGKTYHHPTNNYKDVMTVVDFFLEKRGRKLCVFTDGHTYHERTEDQATHDRNIDRKLQEFGYTVLRYTGKEVRENVGMIVSDIQKWLEIK